MRGDPENAVAKPSGSRWIVAMAAATSAGTASGKRAQPRPMSPGSGLGDPASATAIAGERNR